MGFSRRWALVALPVVILLLHTVLAYVGVIGSGFLSIDPSSAPGEPDQPVRLVDPLADSPPPVRVADLETDAEREAFMYKIMRKNAAADDGIHSSIVEKEITGERRMHRPQELIDQGMPADEFPPDGAMVAFRTHVTVMRKGRGHLVARTFVQNEIGGDWTKTDYQAGVLNDFYVAMYHRGRRDVVQVWEHSSIDAMGPHSKRTAKMHEPTELYDDGIGGSACTFEELMEKLHEDTVWSIEDVEIEGDPCYRISAVWTNPDSGLVRRDYYFVDPRRGYLLRRREHHSPRGGGPVVVDIELAYSETAGRWHPSVVVEDDPPNEERSETRYLRFEINPDLDGSELVIENLDLQEGTVLRRYASEKSGPLHYRYVDGAWAR